MSEPMFPTCDDSADRLRRKERTDAYSADLIRAERDLRQVERELDGLLDNGAADVDLRGPV